MQTITIKRYAFNELSPEAQDSAMEAARLSEYWNYPQDLLSEDMNLQAARLITGEDTMPQGLNLYYDLSHSQGSGVALSGIIYANEAVNLTLPENTYRVNITHSGRYYHEYSFSVEVLDENYEELESESVLNQLQDICRQLEKFGYKWEENYFSDTNVREMLENMGEVFTSSGKLSNPDKE